MNTSALLIKSITICLAMLVSSVAWSQGGQPLNIVAAGDSITRGFGSGIVNSYRFEFEALMQANECSYNMKGSQLTTRSASTYESPHEGYPGWWAFHFINGHPNGPRAIGDTVAAETPDVILALMGANDINGTASSSHATPDIALDNIRRVVSEINDKADEIDLPRPIILLARPCLLYTSPSPRDLSTSRMPSSA